jgi:hypothetical protein
MHGDEAIHVFMKSKFDVWRKWIASSRTKSLRDFVQAPRNDGKESGF